MVGACQRHGRSWVNRLDELHLLTPLRIVAIVIVAIVVTVVLRSVVTRLLRRTLGLSSGDPSRAEARQRALDSALRSAVVGVVWSAAVITIIGEIGVNIGGVLATATVIGGAIAFGAQTLIRDIIAGLFVLAEDQYGVGDQVDLGHASGEVERITLRSVRLRDGEGRVWHVAHGYVVRVGNLSKAAVALLDLEIAHDSDLAAVEEVAGRLGEQLRRHPAVGRLLTGQPEVIGLTDVRDDRLIYRLSAPTLPGTQDDVRRVWRQLALAAFQQGELHYPPAPPTAMHIVRTPSGGSRNDTDRSVDDDDRGADRSAKPHMKIASAVDLADASTGQRLTELPISLDRHAVLLGDLVEADVVAQRAVGEANHEPHADVVVVDVAGVLGAGEDVVRAGVG